MFSITSLPTNSRNFIMGLSNSGNSRNKIVTLCFAKAIADLLPITVAQDNDINATYRVLFELDVMKQISDINELCVLDANAVAMYVKAFYVWRYRVAFNPFVVMCPNPDTCLQDFFAISTAIDSDAIEVIKKENIAAMKYYNGFMVLLREIRDLREKNS